jgi:diguanylate cyclase (GGDEF)-like protein/PAS domain S-box-containing protein
VRRPWLLTLVLLGAAEALLGWAVRVHFLKTVAGNGQAHQQGLAVALANLHRSHGRLVDLAFRQQVDQPAVIDLVAAANDAPEPERARLRGRLYRALYPTYQNLRAHHVRVLQLVLADGRSLLRFHRPDLYADVIAGDRPLIARALADGVAQQGFENGRVYPGFRYVFPLRQGERVVGAADFSVSYDALRRVLQEAEQATGTVSQLLLRRERLDTVLHPSAQGLFRAADLSPLYVVEDERLALREVATSQPLPGWVARVDARLGGSAAVLAAMARGEDHAEHVCLADGQCYAVALQAVRDSRELPAGYAVAYRPAPEYAIAREYALTAFAVGSVLLLSTGLGLRRWLASSRRLRAVSSNMAEGMYVLDEHGRIAYANPAASRLLGYSQAELRSADAHRLFHACGAEGGGRPGQCPILERPRAGGVYRGDGETFRRRDGTTLRVSVVASPLTSDGAVRGVVVLFRDVSLEYEARLRLQQAEVAFRHMAEGVVVTDAGARIQAVNRAFTQITGYEEAEVLGRNPRLLASGRHAQPFYAALWQSLATQGLWEGEIWNRRKSGEVYPEWLRITAVPGDNDAVAGYVAVFSDVTDLRRNEERLRDLAYHDQLTGLSNRPAFLEIFVHALRRAQRQGNALALLYLDLDRFKRINDSLGHGVGDELLAEVGARLHRVVRDADTVARLGGDEFIVLMEDVINREGPARLARKLLEALGEPVDVDEQRLYVTASIGISCFPDDGSDATTLLKNADAAMYLAKQAGRNGYRYFTSAMADEARQRLELEGDLRRALVEDELMLHFQPKVLLPSGRVIGLEGLLRWRHPRLGVLAPGRFLPVAQEAGLMGPLTELVIRKACDQVRAWRDAGQVVPRTAVNLDPHLLACGDIEEILLRQVQAAGIETTDLELEVMETAMVMEERQGQLWQRLAGLGFEIAIDDFGVGESSLARLKALPFATIKIDKSFVQDIESDENDRTIIRTVIAMARSFGKQVLAEGVETEAQLRFLYESGCEAIQGYYFSRPAPPEAVAGMLVDGRFAALARQALEGDALARRA